jgi:hypothetical protein
LPLCPCFRPSTMRDQLPPQFIDIAPRSPVFTRQPPSLDLSPQSILSEPLHFRSPADKLMDPPSAAVLVSIPENVEHDTHVWNALAAGKVMIDNGMYQLASRSFLHGIRLKPASPNVLCTLVSYNFVSRLLATLQAVTSSAHGPSETSRISMLSYAAAISSVPNLAPEHVVLGMQLLASSQLNLGKYASKELQFYHFRTNLVMYLVCANMMKQLLLRAVLCLVSRPRSLRSRTLPCDSSHFSIAFCLFRCYYRCSVTTTLLLVSLRFYNAILFSPCRGTLSIASAVVTLRDVRAYVGTSPTASQAAAIAKLKAQVQSRGPGAARSDERPMTIPGCVCFSSLRIIPASTQLMTCSLCPARYCAMAGIKPSETCPMCLSGSVVMF